MTGKGKNQANWDSVVYWLTSFTHTEKNVFLVHFSTYSSWKTSHFGHIAYLDISLHSFTTLFFPDDLPRIQFWIHAEENTVYCKYVNVACINLLLTPLIKNVTKSSYWGGDLQYIFNQLNYFVLHVVRNPQRIINSAVSALWSSLVSVIVLV